MVLNITHAPKSRCTRLSRIDHAADYCSEYDNAWCELELVESVHVSVDVDCRLLPPSAGYTHTHVCCGLRSVATAACRWPVRAARARVNITHHDKYCRLQTQRHETSWGRCSPAFWLDDGAGFRPRQQRRSASADVPRGVVRASCGRSTSSSLEKRGSQGKDKVRQTL